ncbi:putative uncharacterized protein [Aliivibrio wodanis]|uniref:Uncharacterized protein n=1 Tax=Aliivibrio wodanis TaxID=80852 RepID=A0A090IK73_9GAMM|nr:putative uncharacterized protein [Aliivibrio wodanis]
MKMKLYRGICVKESDFERVKQDILTNGINHLYSESRFQNQLDFIDQSEVALLKNKNAVSESDIQNVVCSHYIFATGDKYGADFYSRRSAVEGDVGLVVEFEVSLDQLMIDGNDYFNKLPIWKPQSQDDLMLAKMIYGEEIEHYVNKIRSTSPKFDFDIWLRLARQDTKLIIAHHQNTKVCLKAGHLGNYHSAFIVRSPVSACKVTNVSRVENFVPKNSVPLATFN